MITLPLYSKTVSPVLPPKKIFLYQKADFQAINDALLETDWDSYLSPIDPNSSWSRFSSHFIDIVNRYTPTKTVTSSPLPAWFPRPLLHKIRLRRTYYQKAFFTNSPTDWKLYRSTRNSVLRELRKAKSSFVSSLSQSTRSFWSYVRSLRKSKSTIPNLSTPVSSASTDKDKANLLNQAFTSFFSPTSPSSLDISQLSTDPTQIPDSHLCSPAKICQLIANLPNNTSPGPDNISSLLLKSTASAISQPLSAIFNLSIKTGSLPLAWKHSIISPIPKTTPPSSAPTDYRPISLLSIVSKLLEKHISHIITDHLYTNQLIPPNQFGFLPQRSTTDAIISVSQSILSTLDSSTSICGVFLDIKKAFDSVSHPLLLQKLHSIHLPPHITLWLHSYLSDRTQSVKVGTTHSSPLPVTTGVPQGSILGPLLFIIFFNDISSLLLSSSSRLFLYADDILLLHPVTSPSDCSLISSQLSIISQWLSSRSLQVNTQKSKYLYFSFQNQAIFNTYPPISISGSPIERVRTFKYLGITLSHNLSWSTHINSLICKSKKLLGLIYRQFYSRSSPKAILSLYITIVRPILEYCSCCWDPPSSSMIAKLEKVQHFALKIASKSWSSTYQSLLSNFNLPTLSHRRSINKITQLFKINHGFSHFLYPPPLHLSQVTRITRSLSPFNFAQPFCRTSTYLHSFYPSAIKIWNSLPEIIKSTNSLSHFKFYLTHL